MNFDDAALARLMALAQAGDARAYAVLLEQCRRWLARFFRNRIPPGKIDDLVQDVLASLHAKRASFDPARPFLPWLAAIARYRWVDQLRRDYRGAEVELGADQAVDSDEEVITARLSLATLMGQLKPAQREAIALVKIEGLSIAEAAASTGQSEALVKVNIHRGLKRLAAAVESD
ncbi:MAG: sigma-70 family RNA polymerase sigma factor [Proteobacteria bacterium]|nr:sigma-70 family RNA polymerase sigma factor [Pseudomonadota bacterium]